MKGSSPIPLSHQTSPPLLDKVLQELSPEQKARVLDLVVHLDLDQDDPLWLIAIAIGQLQVLVEDAPQDWGQLFTAFLEELEQWKTHNLKTLDQLVLEAEAVHHLSQHAKTLSNHISDLQTLLQQLIMSLQASNNNVRNWDNNFATLKRELILTFNTVKVPDTSTSSPPSLAETSRRSQNLSWIVNLLTLAIVVASGIGLGFLWHTQTQQGQTLQWLLEKENRRDCREGVLPPSSPLCH